MTNITQLLCSLNPSRLTTSLSHSVTHSLTPALTDALAVAAFWLTETESDVDSSSGKHAGHRRSAKRPQSARRARHKQRRLLLVKNLWRRTAAVERPELCGEQATHDKRGVERAEDRLSVALLVGVLNWVGAVGSRPQD